MGKEDTLTKSFRQCRLGSGLTNAAAAFFLAHLVNLR